jgi:hypothetical protein
MGLLKLTALVFPGVNAWARENVLRRLATAGLFSQTLQSGTPTKV